MIKQTKKFKNIAILSPTYDRLTAATQQGKTYDDFINQLLDEHDERGANEIIRLRNEEAGKE
jgi:hypothetical protein